MEKRAKHEWGGDRLKVKGKGAHPRRDRRLMLENEQT